MRLAFLEEVFDMAEPFWKTVPFDEMTNAQWESLCDGCGKCCLIKLQDADTEEIVFTDVVYHLLDVDPPMHAICQTLRSGADMCEANAGKFR